MCLRAFAKPHLIHRQVSCQMVKRSARWPSENCMDGDPAKMSARWPCQNGMHGGPLKNVRPVNRKKMSARRPAGPPYRHSQKRATVQTFRRPDIITLSARWPIGPPCRHVEMSGRWPFLKKMSDRCLPKTQKKMSARWPSETLKKM